MRRPMGPDYHGATVIRTRALFPLLLAALFFLACGEPKPPDHIVVITLEAADDPAATRWSGPIVFRGMSRSGMMHTMVGHGALQQENCAAYGYGS